MLAPKHSVPSMSKSALLLSPCIRWADPQAGWYDEDLVASYDNEARDNGIAFHEAIDHYNVSSQVQPFKDETLNKLVAHAVAYLDTQLGPRCDTIQSEVAIAVNWLTGEARLLTEVQGRAYPKWATEGGWQPGTADLVCILKTGELMVADWKTGGNDGAEEQLLSLAYGLRKLLPEQVVTGTTLGCIPIHRPVSILCLSVNEHGVWPHEQEVSEERLQAHADAMRFQWEDIGKRNKPKPGVHCTALYCPHLAYCPAIQAGVRDLAEKAPESTVGPKVGQMVITDTPSSDKEAGDVMAVVSAANRQIKYITAAMKDRVKRGLKVVNGQYEWSDGGNGFRWRKN